MKTYGDTRGVCLQDWSGLIGWTLTGSRPNLLCNPSHHCALSRYSITCDLCRQPFSIPYGYVYLYIFPQARENCSRENKRGFGGRRVHSLSRKLREIFDKINVVFWLSAGEEVDRYPIGHFDHRFVPPPPSSPLICVDTVSGCSASEGSDYPLPLSITGGPGATRESRPS